MNALESLLRSFVELHPEDAARAFETLPMESAVRLFKTLPLAVAADLADRLSVSVAAPLFEQLDDDRCQKLLSELPARTATALVQLLDDQRRRELFQRMPESRVRQLKELADYPEETAGGMMEPRVVSFPIDLTVEQAIAAIRKAPRDALYYLYVTRRNGELVGVLNMRDLLLTPPRNSIEPLVHRNVLSVPATMDREEVVRLMREHRFLALPVVNIDGRLVGVVKHDEAIESGQLEAFEDLQKMVGVGGDERALSPVPTVVKRRLPWLFVNLVTAFVAAAVVGMFESLIAEVAALAVLLPVVAGQGGNSGSQSLAIVMRGLALREVVTGTRRRVITKEVVAGLLNSLAVAIVTSAGVFLWKGSTGLSLVIGLAMIVTMTTAAAAGTVIPLLLRALGRDPAQSASIFLTTVTDVVGFGSFLGFAVVFSRMLL